MTIRTFCSIAGLTFLSALPAFGQDLMELSLDDLLAIDVVSASKRGQKISEAPAIISTITAQQIQDRGYLTVGEALASLPGLDVLTDHLQYNMGVRGINGGLQAWSRIVKVMIDNQPISFRSSTENFLGEELIPISAIERIEVVRGPASALYGANAFLGVVNIITKNPEKIDGGVVSGRVGTVQNNLAGGGNVTLGRKFGNLSVLLSGAYSSTDRSGLKVQNLPNGTTFPDTARTSENDMTKPVSLFAKLSYNDENIGKISLDANYQRLHSFAEFQDYSTLTHNNLVSMENMYVRTEYAKDITPELSMAIRAAYAQGAPTSSEKLVTRDRRTSDFVTRDVGYKGIDAAMDFSYVFGEKNSITFGADYTADDHNLQTFYYNFNDGKPATPVQSIINGDTTFSNAGVFVQAIAFPFSGVLNSLGLTVGLRYDAHNIYENVLNYRAAATYQFSDKIYGKLLYGTSFKAPTAMQLFTNTLAGGLLPNPTLKPEKARTLEFALGAQIGDGLNIVVNGFANNVQDAVEIQRDLITSNFRAVNVDKMVSLGAEIDAVFVIQHFQAYANWSYQRSSVWIQDLSRGEIEVSTRTFPVAMLKAGAQYTIPALASIGAEFRYIGERIASNPNISATTQLQTTKYTLQDYFLLDIALTSQGFRFIGNKETTLQLKINNILDKEYYLPGFQNFDIQGLNRSIMFSVTQQF